MSWSYSDPSQGARDWVRWRVGDTDSSDQLQSNEEIDAALDLEGNRYKAAATVAEAIAGKFGRRADKTVGPLSIKASQQAASFFALAERLRREAGRRVAPWLGGQSEDERDTAEADTDRIHPEFEVGQHDLEGSGVEDPLDNLADSWT